MRVVQLIPGTGTFHCGTCLRDHALARALRRAGHDVLLTPLYLPLVLEHDEDAGGPVFFGGINVYLQEKTRLFRHTPTWLDRWLDAPALLRWLANRSGMTRASELGDLTISMLRGEEGRQGKELDRLTDWLAEQPEPDVILLATGLLVGMARRIKEAIDVPVVCTLQGEDTFLDALPPPQRDEAWRNFAQRSQDVDQFVGVSAYYGETMTRRLGLPDDRVHVVHNGIDLEDLEPASSTPAVPILGYLAQMNHSKGVDTLVEAYVLLRRRGRIKDLRLRIAGAVTRNDERLVHVLQERLRSEGLAGDVEFLPNIDRSTKADFLRTLSVFSVPATYGEAFGLYVLEALACGIPVVQPRHGAFEELLNITGGGILCEPDDVPALAEAIERTLLDLGQARAHAAQAREVVIEKFNTDRMARDVVQVCDMALRRHKHHARH